MLRLDSTSFTLHSRVGYAQDRQVEEYLAATAPEEMLVIETYQEIGYDRPAKEPRYLVGYCQGGSSFSVSGASFGFRDISDPGAPVMCLWVCHIKSIRTCV